MTPEEHRRRIDEILDPSFLGSLDTLEPEVLREKLRDVRTEEDALSYIRRNLHGRLDLLRAELEFRKGGRGTDRDAETLATRAMTPQSAPGSRGGRVGLGLRAAAVAGRRRTEQILSEDHLARLPDLSESEIEHVVERVTEAEQQLSAHRHRLHEVIDTLEGELARRYKDGLALSLDRLQ